MVSGFYEALILFLKNYQLKSYLLNFKKFFYGFRL